MRIRFEILRGSRLWRIDYETNDPKETVAGALRTINDAGDYREIGGDPVGEIGWECSCLQKKCGACAMRINQTPALACDSRLAACAKMGVIRLEPLKKFPVVRDLIVDRSVMRENLKTMRLWLEQDAMQRDSQYAYTYDASRCLQCGCCLEVCPNFYAGGAFAGTAAAVPFSRLLSEASEAQKKKLFTTYRRQIYEGCGKSLACRNVCPAGIGIDALLVNDNALAVWKRKLP